MVSDLQDSDGLICSYIQEAIHSVHTWEDFQTEWHSHTLAPLIEYLSDSVQHRCIVHALLCVLSSIPLSID
jgi:hypothetical protein